MGGGGITSLKDLIIESKTNTVKDGNYTITYSASSNGGVSMIHSPWEATTKNTNDDDAWISANYGPLPQWWQVDLGRVVNGICKFSFTTGRADAVDILMKDYELYYSLDGTDFTKLYSGTYVPKTNLPGSHWKYQTEYCEFNYISARYFRISILSAYFSRDYRWVGFTDARLYAALISGLYLKESDNNIYGSVDNEITQITTLDTWNNSSIEEKKNFFLITNNVLSIDQLKSLGKFKVLNEPKN